MYEILDKTSEHTIGIRVSDTLTSSDYHDLRPYLEQKARVHQPLRVLFHMDNWHGWDDLSALWEDLKTDVSLNKYVERLAMVGDEDWERWMTQLSKPFAKGKIRYFDEDQLDEAWRWLRQ